ncbi:hypothetical protein Tco_1297933 [Tanacetum coccineum]
MTGELLRGIPEDNIRPTPTGIIGSTLGGPLEVNVEPPLTETTPFAGEQIKGHLLAIRSLLKEHNARGNVSPIHLSFDDVEDRKRVRMVVTRKEIGDADLKRHFKEAVKIPLTRRIINKLRGMAHTSVVSYVPTNPKWECEGMVQEPLARKHRRMSGTRAAVHN